MEIEVLKKSNVKRNIIIGVFVVLIISAIVLNFTRARYRVTDSVPLINSEINYKVPDLNMVSLYVANEEGDYIEADIIPSSGYTLNTEQSYCGQSNNGEIVRDDTVSIVYENGSISVNNITRKGTKCYLYFNETFDKIILADNPTIDNSRNSEITGPLTENTTGTLFTAEDNDGTSYIFAGDVDNNWVSFAGFYWRIIRINGDGSIRMIYSGDSSSGPVETGESTQIGTSAFNEQANDNAYVGYMYGTPGSSTYEETHANINDSTIKTVLDTWYEENLLSYSNYISTEAGFCNDRSVNTTDEIWWNGDTKLGYGTNTTAYGAYGRLVLNGIFRNYPILSLKCSETNDLFTISKSNKGNYELTYSAGLITSDEVVLAGGFGGVANESYYLYTGEYYWTMSPYFLDTIDGVSLFRISSSGNLYNSYLNNVWGVRPVINLDKNVTLSSGNGTINSPYVLSGN